MKAISGFFKLDIHDLIKGLYMAVIGAVIGLIYPIIQSGSFHFDWAAIWHAALTAAGGYLLKNLFTNNQGDFLKKDQ